MPDNKYDYCSFCGAKVHPYDWREHMLKKHGTVLSESPKNKNGSWKKPEKCKLASLKLNHKELQNIK